MHGGSSGSWPNALPGDTRVAALKHPADGAVMGRSPGQRVCEHRQGSSPDTEPFILKLHPVLVLVLVRAGSRGAASCWRCGQGSGCGRCGTDLGDHGTCLPGRAAASGRPLAVSVRPSGRPLPVSVRPAVAMKRQGVRCVSSPTSLVTASRHNSLLWTSAPPIRGADIHNDFGRARWGGRWTDGAGETACRRHAGTGLSSIASRTAKSPVERLTIAYADKPIAGYASRHRQASRLAPGRDCTMPLAFSRLGTCADGRASCREDATVRGSAPVRLSA